MLPETTYASLLSSKTGSYVTVHCLTDYIVLQSLMFGTCDVIIGRLMLLECLSTSDWKASGWPLQPLQ